VKQVAKCGRGDALAGGNRFEPKPRDHRSVGQEPALQEQIGAFVKKNGMELGVTVITGGKGVKFYDPTEEGAEKILEFQLDAEEQAMMDKSVAAVKGLVDSLKL